MKRRFTRGVFPRSGPTLIEVAIIVAIIGILGAVGYSIYYNIRHPCIETRPVQTTCGGETYCQVWDAYSNCIIWASNPTYPCTVQKCVRRKP